MARWERGERHRVSGEDAEEERKTGPAVKPGERTPLPVLKMHRRGADVGPSELIEVVVDPGRGSGQEEPDDVVSPHGPTEEPKEARDVFDLVECVQIYGVENWNEVVHEVGEGGEQVEEVVVHAGYEEMGR